MDDESGLINMNAREYDPVIGRFLTPDPFVQSPSNSQSYNRYSYVWNNPLASTDPSGYFNIFKKDDWKNFTSGTLERVGRNKYLGGLTQMGLLTHPFGFGIAYGASTGDWNTVGRAYATNAVLAASVWAGGAAWGAYGAYGGSILGAGIFVAESAAIGYTSSYATAWIYGASNDEARHAALLAAKRAAVMAGARVGYNALVGYDSTPKPGENRPGNTRYIPDESGRLQPQDIGRNVVLLNENYEGLDCSLCRDAFRQGSPLSRALNDVPGINAIGGLDDFLNNVVPTSMGDSLWFKGVTIPAAVFVTVPALLDGIPIYLIDPLGRQR
jgi:RHS repeat-associated protein